MKKRGAGKNSLKLEIPYLHLLPGTYSISIGGREMKRFFVYSERRDHGIVYMPHKWEIKIP